MLHQHPLDALALQVANTFDYYTGNAPRMLARVESVLPAWQNDMPGCHAVLATHAFALEEHGEYEHAEQAAREALALNPLDIRAHHVMLHVFEMTDRPDAGVRWMNAQIAAPGAGSLFTTHCWWHLALFHLALGQTDLGLAMRLPCLMSPEWNDATQIVRTRVTRSLLTRRPAKVRQVE
ncbi:MAG TPA: hypothetical protein VIW70_00960 [Rubrivivax sp.]